MNRFWIPFAFFLFPLIAFAADSPSALEVPRMLPTSPAPPAHSLAPPRPCPRYDLHGAVQFPGTRCLEQAIRNMDVNDRDVDGDTPLHNAIRLFQPDAIRFLVRNGADLHLNDFHGQNAIALADQLGHAKLHDFLRAVERETERLVEAVEINDTVAMNQSLLRGASLGTRDLRLDTPLHRAAESGVTDAGQLLVHHGANLEARNYLGETPLFTAVLRDQNEFAKMLIAAGAKLNALDERRRTPLDIAEIHDNKELVALFAQRHAKNGAAASVEFDFDAVNGEVDTAPVSAK